MQKITTFFWFDGGKADEAARFYVSVFKKGKVTGSNPMSTSFTLFGQKFIALNGNAQHPFNPSISLFVDCKDQKEVDTLWAKLTADGGRAGMCGWLVDKYGVSWQIIPAELPRLLGHKDRAKAQRAIDAMLKMQKIDVSELKRAAKG